MTAQHTRQSLTLDDVMTEDASGLFHEEDMDESGLSKYDYSMREQTSEDDPHARLKRFTEAREQDEHLKELELLEHSICSLGQSARDNYVPRNFCEEYQGEPQISESASEKVKEPQPPTRPSFGRRGLLASTKSSRSMSPPPLRSASSEGGGVWKSMRSLGRGSKDAEGESAKPLKKWNSFKWSTKGTPLEGDDDDDTEDNSSTSNKEPEMPEDEDDDEDFPAPRPASSNKNAKVSRGISRMNSLKKATSFKVKKSTSADTEEPPLPKAREAPASRGVSRMNSLKKAASFKIKKSASADATAEPPVVKAREAPASRGVSRLGSLKRATSYKMKKSASVDTHQQPVVPKARNAPASRGVSRLHSLTKAASFKVKKTRSMDPADDSHVPVTSNTMKKSGSSNRLNLTSIRPQAPSRGRMHLKKAASFKVKKSTSLDPSGPLPTMKKSTSFVRTKPIANPCA